MDKLIRCIYIIIIILITSIMFLTELYAFDRKHVPLSENNPQQDIDLIEAMELLIELVSNLDNDTIKAITDFLGVEYDASANKEQIISHLIRTISRNYQLLDLVRNIDGELSFRQTVDGETIAVQSSLSMKRQVRMEDRAYTQYIFLYCSASYADYEVKADSIILNIEDKEDGNTSLSDIEVMASGNIVFSWGNFTFHTDKAFFYPSSMRAIMYNVSLYAPDMVGVLLEASEAKIISIEEIILIDVTLSGDFNLSDPHYKLHLNKVWVYPDMDAFAVKNLFASHLIFQVGQTPLFYLPLWFQMGFSSGISISIKYEQSLGFYIQTTTGFNLSDFSNDLIADYYQKMGLYFSLKDEVLLFSFIDIELAGAYDRAVEYVGRSAVHWGELSNYVDIDNDGVAEETFNSLRYYLGIDAPYILYEGGRVLYGWRSSIKQRDSSLVDILFSIGNDGLANLFRVYMDNLFIGFDLDYMKISDPNFEEQFMDFPRSEAFTLSTDIIYKEKTIAVYAPDSPGSSSTAMNLNTGISLTTLGLKAEVGGNWIWSFRSRYEELNPYDVLNYYAIQPYMFLFPDLSIEYESNFSNNLIDDAIKGWLMVFNPDKAFSSLSYIIPDLKLSLPIEYEVDFSYVLRQRYVEEGTEVKDPSDDDWDDDAYGYGFLEEGVGYTTVGFAYSLPFVLGYDFFEFSISMEYNIDYTKQSTHVNIDKIEEEIQADDVESTKYEWEWLLSSSIGFEFFDEYEYLEFGFGLSAEYKYSGDFDDLAYHLGLNDTEHGISFVDEAGETLEFNSIYISFLKTDIELIGVNIPLRLDNEDMLRLGEIISLTDSEGEPLSILVDKEYLLQQKYNEYYKLNLENHLLDGFTFSVTYKEKSRLDFIDYRAGGRKEAIVRYGLPSLFGGRGYSLRILSKYRLPIDLFLLNTIYINDIRLNIDYNHYYGKEATKRDNLNLAFLIDFEVLPFWRFGISYEVENKELWKYKLFGYIHPDNAHPRGVLEDIWWALSIWDAEKLQKTYWKIKSLSINIDHDLAEWKLLVSLQFYPRVFDHYIVFQPLLSVTIIFLDFPDFSGGSEGDGRFDNYIYDRY